MIKALYKLSKNDSLKKVIGYIPDRLVALPVCDVIVSEIALSLPFPPLTTIQSVLYRAIYGTPSLTSEGTFFGYRSLQAPKHFLLMELKAFF